MKNDAILQLQLGGFASKCLAEALAPLDPDARMAELVRYAKIGVVHQGQQALLRSCARRPGRPTKRAHLEGWDDLPPAPAAVVRRNAADRGCTLREAAARYVASEHVADDAADRKRLIDALAAEILLRPSGGLSA